MRSIQHATCPFVCLGPTKSEAKFLEGIGFVEFPQLFWEAYVSLQLRVQNQRRKWNFPLNF